jgi:acyl-CoA hydrolase
MTSVPDIDRPTRLSMTILMTPDMANFAGNVHGGSLLKLLDQVAYSCASRYAGTYVVTLSVDRVYFRDVIHVGELVTFSASVNYTGRTSMEIGIRVDTENIQQQSKRHTNSSYFTMVAVDAGGTPVPVPRDRCTPMSTNSDTNPRASDAVRYAQRSPRHTAYPSAPIGTHRRRQ